MTNVCSTFSQCALTVLFRFISVRCGEKGDKPSSFATQYTQHNIIINSLDNFPEFVLDFNTP